MEEEERVFVSATLHSSKWKRAGRTAPDSPQKFNNPSITVHSHVTAQVSVMPNSAAAALRSEVRTTTPYSASHHRTKVAEVKVTGMNMKTNAPTLWRVPSTMHHVPHCCGREEWQAYVNIRCSRRASNKKNRANKSAKVTC